ncbi:MAG: xanthine dehydrogenase family protein subunit M [Chloroflexota bacterium]|nr:xanthine dehydrogenase family protein subunit M [Chloroflexota bacterium]
MNPSTFDYYRPDTVSEAIALLQEHGENGKLLAGGHSLLPIMKLRLAEPDALIDIGRIDALRGVTETAGGLSIGALTTHRQVATDPLIDQRAPLLAVTASRVGDRQVRARGTIGGALAHADAAADYPAAILALNATMVAEGPAGERKIAGGDFFLDFLTTALEPSEVLTRIEIPAQPDGAGWSYQKLANQASGYAIVGVAVLLVVGEDGKISEARIGGTGMAAVPWRAVEAEQALIGAPADDDSAITAAANLIDLDIEALDDLHGSAEYRRRVARGLARRAIQEAIAASGE